MASAAAAMASFSIRGIPHLDPIQHKHSLLQRRTSCSSSSSVLNDKLASSAAAMASFSIRRIPHLDPIQHKHSLLRRRTSCSSSSSVLNNKSQSVCVSHPASVICSKRIEREAIPAHDILRGSTRTLATMMGMALLFLKVFQKNIPNLVLCSSNNMSMMGPLFFASLRDRPSGYLNTPLTVVAAGLGKWLDIYSGVLMVRVLLSWFPNIPWERQPLSAIRDLCDPYLNLFRNIIPPVFDTLDVSPLLAFAVLGTLGSILQTAMA